jgi:outer membrane lipoprotein LolB
LIQRVLLAWMVAGFALAGCVSVRTQPAESPALARAYQLRLEHLRPLDHWALDGRLAISDGKDGGSGSLSWYNDKQVTRMSFRGALGKGAWQLLADPAGARLELANGTVHYAPTVAELVLQQVGWKIPVDALSWWIKGLAYPGKFESRDLDDNGCLKSLRQLGWDVKFANYTEPDNFWLPAKLTARRGHYSVKMVVRTWHIGAEGAKLE